MNYRQWNNIIKPVVGYPGWVTALFECSAEAVLCVVQTWSDSACCATAMFNFDWVDGWIDSAIEHTSKANISLTYSMLWGLCRQHLLLLFTIDNSHHYYFANHQLNHFRCSKCFTKLFTITHSYMDGTGCCARCQPAHQKPFWDSVSVLQIEPATLQSLDEPQLPLFCAMTEKV